MTSTDKKQKILFLGSKVKIRNLPIKEVSLIEEGNLPAYGYNPGDFVELMAGKVGVENGRLDQCQTWLASYLTTANMSPKVTTVTYGEQKDIFQVFRKRQHPEIDKDHGWFMVHQILPYSGRGQDEKALVIDDSNRDTMSGHAGIIIIDDGGRPPELAEEMKKLNPGAWVIAMGISVAHWAGWAKSFGENFVLFGRLADLETTRMEMDSSVVWESIVAMTLRALRSPEVGIWDQGSGRFRCHVMIEMFPHGILNVTPTAVYFRHREGSLPEKSSPRQKGSVPAYDTLATAMLAMDFLRMGKVLSDRCYYCDFSKRALLHWQLLYEKGYYFSETLEFPNLDFSSTYPNGAACSFLYNDDPFFIELPVASAEFDKSLETVSSQVWDTTKRAALRSFFDQSAFLRPSYVIRGHAPGYMRIIMEVLHDLKEEVSRKSGFDNLRIFNVGHLRTTDPAEIGPVLVLQTVMDSYVSKETFQRPLCLGVFGPPGSGKSFAVKEVARVVGRKFDDDPFDFFEFNLTQFAQPDEINSAIDLIRASVAKGKVPITFWDEFDCRYDGHEFGYLRYFLPSMQDGVTYVHGIPYYIGRAIFVFAGGVKSSWEGMEEMLTKATPQELQLAKTLKIPDFMSRLRVVLDIDGIDIEDELLRDSASQIELEELRRILLKRAFIIAHQMDTHWKKTARKTSGLLLRLLIAQYKFGARSIEAVIEASRVTDRLVYGLPELIGPSGARIHAQWRTELERRVDQVRKQEGMRSIW
ncbi:MAG: ATPase [Desulfobulbaceae bacterium]|uniref:ATPase n=1 Tax=Candidatus Desulfobia pelagia TaxID=2841692 RepID=A0A8J6TGQ6_9BACT|nr:ATPase [Candidatus Desulfobia pelagia]